MISVSNSSSCPSYKHLCDHSHYHQDDDECFYYCSYHRCCHSEYDDHDDHNCALQ